MYRVIAAIRRRIKCDQDFFSFELAKKVEYHLSWKYKTHFVPLTPRRIIKQDVVIFSKIAIPNKMAILPKNCNSRKTEKCTCHSNQIRPLTWILWNCKRQKSFLNNRPIKLFNDKSLPWSFCIIMPSREVLRLIRCFKFTVTHKTFYKCLFFILSLQWERISSSRLHSELRHKMPNKTIKSKRYLRYETLSSVCVLWHEIWR